MKQVYLIIFCMLLSIVAGLLRTPSVFAQTTGRTSTSSATPSPTKSETQTKNLIDNLKDRIASRVAELKLVEKRGIIGTVTQTSHTQLTLSDLGGNVRYVDVDELTKFTSDSSDESFGISDIKEGDKLGILGLYNKQSRRILARFIDVVTIKQFIPATIIDVDQQNFTVTFVGKDKKQYVADVEKATKTFAHSKKDGLLRSGFSKIEPGMHTIIIGFTDVKESNRIIASRILLFPQIPKNPEIEVPETSAKPTLKPTDESSTSTGSGKKLTPLKR